MWPQAEDPSFGCFVAEQVEALRALGQPLELLFIDGRRSKLNYLRGIFRLRRALRRGWVTEGGEGRRPFGLVHAHYVLSGWAALMAGARRPGRPLLVTHHGIEVFEGWQAPLARLLSRLVDRSLVISAEMAARLGLDAEDILPCGIDLDRFSPQDRAAACAALGLDPGRRRVAWVGAPRPEKRLDLARQAMARLGARQARPPDLGPAAADGRGSLAAADRSEVDLHVVSGLAPAAVPAQLAACDALLVTSSREGGPLVVKEALAMGLPVVSTAVGDVAGLLAGLPGCAVVAEASPPLLAAGLAEALAEALAQGPVPGARERVRPYEQGRVAARLAAIYGELQAARPEGRTARMDRGILGGRRGRR